MYMQVDTFTLALVKKHFVTTFCWVFQASSHLLYPYPAQCLIGLRTISCIIHANKKPYNHTKLRQCIYDTCIVLL